MNPVFAKILWYMNPRRKHDPNAPASLNLKFMHGINKISIFVFLGALLLVLVRKLFFS
jgi:hypothetical protein